MLDLDPASAEELAKIGDKALTKAVERVRADPSGQLEPKHRYTERFKNASKYANVGKRDVREFKPSKWRGLFVVTKGPSGKQGIFFIAVKGRRFMTLGECPWHKGK